MNISNYEMFRNGAQFRMDSNETRFVIQALEDLESEVYKVEYPDLLSDLLIPLDTSVNTGAKVTSFDMIDYQGEANIESGMSNTVPTLNSSSRRTAKKVYSARLSYTWTLQDVRAAAMAGVPLNSENAEGVREGVETRVDKACALGDADTEIEGFVNHSAVGAPIAPTGAAWVQGTTTVQQIVNDLNKLQNSIVTDTLNKNSMKPDTIVLPVEQYTVATSTFNEGTDRTALSIFVQNSPFVKTVVPWHYMSQGPNGPRAVAYRRDPKVLQKVIPQPFELLPPFQRSSTLFEQEGHMRLAGVKMRYPVAVRYMDGI